MEYENLNTFQQKQLKSLMIWAYEGSQQPARQIKQSWQQPKCQ